MQTASASEILSAEYSAINDYGIPEIILMENAGFALADVIISSFSKDKTILLLAGLGNNAGDGFVAARHLINAGYSVSIMLNNKEVEKSSYNTNLNILKNMKADFISYSDTSKIKEYNIIIDGLFGTGLNREITSPYKEIIECANKSNSYKIAIDIPSGLLADSQELPKTVFFADTTISFAAHKICNTLYPSKKASGKVILKDISIPKNCIKSNITFVEKKDLPALKKRDKESHKGTYGRAFFIGGSINMTGAIKIAAKSAISSGCGLVTCAYPNNITLNPFTDFMEAISFPFAFDKSNDLIDKVNTMDAVSIGNGMGTSNKEFIKNIIFNIKKPCLIDADGINALSINDLKYLNENTVITPHLKEFARLIGYDIEYIKNNSLELALSFAKKYNVILVLKSTDTIIASPLGHSYIMAFGNSSLSKGGSGDALAGLITSFLAQGYKSIDAAVLGVYFLGRSAELIVKEKQEETVLISDIINSYSEVFSELRI